MLRNIHFISFILYDMRNEVLYVSHYVLLFLCDNLGILCHVTYIMSHIQIYCYRLLYTVFLIKHTMCVYMYVCLRTSIYTHTHIYTYDVFTNHASRSALIFIRLSITCPLLSIIHYLASFCLWRHFLLCIIYCLSTCDPWWCIRYPCSTIYHVLSLVCSSFMYDVSWVMHHALFILTDVSCAIMDYVLCIVQCALNSIVSELFYLHLCSLMSYLISVFHYDRVLLIRCYLFVR